MCARLRGFGRMLPGRRSSRRGWSAPLRRGRAFGCHEFPAGRYDDVVVQDDQVPARDAGPRRWTGRLDVGEVGREVSVVLSGVEMRTKPALTVSMNEGEKPRRAHAGRGRGPQRGGVVLTLPRPRRRPCGPPAHPPWSCPRERGDHQAGVVAVGLNLVDC